VFEIESEINLQNDGCCRRVLLYLLLYYADIF